MAVLDSIKEDAGGRFSNWEYSDSFFCSGYKFRLAIARYIWGQTCCRNLLPGMCIALDFVPKPGKKSESLNGVRQYVDLEVGSKITAKCRKRNEGNNPSADEEFLKSMTMAGPYSPRNTK